MMRAEAVDMGDGLLQRGHYLHGQDEVVVLRAPVLLGGLIHLRQGPGALVAAELHPGLMELLGHDRQESQSRILMHQQGLHGVAHRGILQLGIVADPNSHLQVGSRVNIGVAYAVGMTEHRYLGMLLDEPDQLVGAPGDDQVHELVHVQQAVDLLAGG